MHRRKSVKEEVPMNSSHYEQLLVLAEQIATKAHEGQVDKAGVPYIHHPRTVSSFCDSVEGKIVGWLHDVVEDTDVTLEDLRMQGFDEVLLEALDCVTKPEVGYDEEAYYKRIKSNPLAKEVKLADLKHNSDMSRIPDGLSEEQYNKWISRKEKYAGHIAYLLNE